MLVRTHTVTCDILFEERRGERLGERRGGVMGEEKKMREEKESEIREERDYRRQGWGDKWERRRR
jgi:hypothetical protein